MVVSKICQTHYAYIDLELNGGEYKTDPDRQVWSFYLKKNPVMKVEGLSTQKSEWLL